MAPPTLADAPLESTASISEERMETSPGKRKADAEEVILKIGRMGVVADYESDSESETERAKPAEEELEIVHEEGPALSRPSPTCGSRIVSLLLDDKGADLRIIEELESRIWLKEQSESVSSEESAFLELRDYVVVDTSGANASLLDVTGERRYFIFGHLYLSNLGQDFKPNFTGDMGYLGSVRVELSTWGIWWVDPKPILYVAVIDKELGLDATLELHRPAAAYADDEARSRDAHLRRLMDIANIVLFEFADKYPKATLKQEETRAKEDPDEAVITLDSDGEDTEEDQRVVGLHRLLMERRGMALEDLKRDEATLSFIARQLEAEHMQNFYKMPLIQSLLKRDEAGNPLKDGQEPSISEGLLKQAPDHPLVVTPRVKQTLLRCMMDLLGDHAYGQSLIIPKDVPFNRNGEALRIKASGEGVEVKSAKTAKLTIQHQAVRIFYKNGNQIRVRIGDYVRTLDPDALQFLKVLRLWQTEEGKWKCHGLALRSADNTMIGICGLPSELVYTNSCATILVKYIEDVVKVDVEDAPAFESWRSEGRRQDAAPKAAADTPSSYRLRFRYDDTADDLAFTYLSREEKADLRAVSVSAIVCRRCLAVADRKEELMAAIVKDAAEETIRLCGFEFRLGQTAYLAPDSFQLKFPRDRSSIQERRDIKSAVSKYVDHPEKIYPESRHYQKQLERGEFKKNFIEPYMVARLHRVIKDGKGNPLALEVVPFYRATDVDFGSPEANADEAGFLRVYLSNEVAVMGLEAWARYFRGRCWVKGAETEEAGEAWVVRGEDRFYCHRRYSVEKEASAEGRRVLKTNFVPLTEEELRALEVSARGAPDLPATANLQPSEKLCSLEMFCGGGGSSTGLHAAGIVTRTALDMDGEAVCTMRRNAPHADVRQVDVNEFLQSSIDGKAGFPQNGDFDVVFGGPPCQGFSAMNRSPNTANSKKKNTCVTTQCGAYDYFRPAYTALENVHGLLNQKEDAYSGSEGKKTSVCNVIVAVMLDLGFQVRVYQLNAGAYGVPQCRNRVFIVGAAPEHVLPAIPKPMYASQLPPVIVTGINARSVPSGFRTLSGWSAPLPELTVNDAISDLPPTTDGICLRRVPYGSKPLTWYQKQMRGSQSEVTAHESRALSVLDRIRVRLLPHSSVALPEPDWRLLPNIPFEEGDVRLYPLKYDQEGSDKAIYRFQCPTCPKDYHIRVKGRKAPTWKCSLPSDSVIPAGLTHKSKNNPWRDCYGRVSRHLWFRTITTGDSLNQQAGRILHPDQPRILTTRELARAQGFPDWWVPEGRISSKTRQIGNAVPPPLTRAIGFEIRKAHALRDQLNAPPEIQLL